MSCPFVEGTATEVSCSFTHHEAGECIPPQTTSGRLLELVSTLDHESALNGRELAQLCGISSKEVQKILPFLAKSGRVTREKRPNAERGRYYYYWMTPEQNHEYARRLKPKEPVGPCLELENAQLKRANQLLRSKLQRSQEEYRLLKERLQMSSGSNRLETA